MRVCRGRRLAVRPLCAAFCLECRQQRIACGARLRAASLFLEAQDRRRCFRAGLAVGRAVVEAAPCQFLLDTGHQCRVGRGCGGGRGLDDFGNCVRSGLRLRLRGAGGLLLVLAFALDDEGRHLAG